MDGLNINPWLKSYCYNNDRKPLLFSIEKQSIETQTTNSNSYISSIKYKSYKKDGELLLYFYNNSLNYKHF